MKQKSRFLLGLTAKDLLVFLSGFFIFTIGLVRYYRAYPITSDDVAQKVLLHQFSLSAHTLLLPPDNFILKLPINIVIDALIHNPAVNVFATTWVMNLIGFFLFFVVGKYFVSKYSGTKAALIVYYAAFILMCARGLGFITALASPNIRTIEIGLSFGLLWFIDRYLLPADQQKPRLQPVPLLFSSLFLGIFLYSDPAFLVFLVAPLLLAAGIYIYQHKSYAKLTPLFIFLAGGIVFYEVFLKTFSRLGIHTYSVPAIFVGWDQLGSSLNVGLQSVFAIQNASFFGLPVFKVATILIILNFIIMLLVAVALPIKLSGQKRFWLTFFAIQPLYLIASYVSSNNVSMYPGSSRYVVLLPFYGVILLALGVTKYRRAVCIILLVIAAGSFVSNIQHLTQLRHNHPNNFNENIASILEENHLQKGYATYWNANISAFYADYKVDVFPLICNVQQTRPFYWVINSDLLRTPQKRTFVITYSPSPGTAVDPIEASTQGGQECSNQIVEKTFGRPEQIVSVTASTKILIYNYDLMNAMHIVTNPQNP